MSIRVMRTAALTVLLVAFGGMAVAQEVPVQQEQEREKRAQTGMKFTSLSVSPRASALGGAVTSVSLGASSVYYNPAGLSRVEGFGDLRLNQTQWIADITHNTAALALNPFNGQYGTIGLSVRSVDYGQFERTRRADTDAGYVQMGTYSPSALELGLTYARSVTDRFSVGGTVKYARQQLGTGSIRLNEDGSVESKSFEATTPAFDFGVMYNPGFESLRFAMSARNFSPALSVIEQNYELPLTLNVGISMDVLDLTGMGENHTLLVSVDTAHPRDFAKTVSFGGEYSFMDIIYLRGGYTTPSDTRSVNLGGGVHYGFNGLELSADYTYSSMEVFGSVNRIGVGIGF